MLISQASKWISLSIYRRPVSQEAFSPISQTSKLISLSVSRRLMPSLTGGLHVLSPRLRIGSLYQLFVD
jgi:hypothetical protein